MIYMTLLDVLINAIYLVLPIFFLPALLTMRYYAKRSGAKQKYKELQAAGIINPRKLYR
ncbi:hypothetical protein vBSalMSz_79 [Salmonella phage vB_SalM_Sz]|nr:DEAD/DEAH box helicase [Escherichia phage vB_EcoM_SD350]